MLNPFFYLQAIWQALAQIWVNKTRSLLTTLGIVIGVLRATSSSSTTGRPAWIPTSTPGPRSE
ncbi:MAG: hypothetical protein ACYSTY_10265 [Planctomycetota bacterium]|jgi:hypothetical protein